MVQNLIKQMIAVEPSVRPTFDNLLHTSRGTVLPESFYSFFHNYVSSINELSTPSPFAAQPAPPVNVVNIVSPTTPSSTIKGTATVASATGNLNGDVSTEPLPSDSDHRMNKIWADFESVEPYLLTETVEETVMDIKVEYTPTAESSKPFQVNFV